MEPQGDEASAVRSFICAAIVEATLTDEQRRIEELHQRKLQEQLEMIRSEVLRYRELVQRDEEAVKIEQDNVKSKEANLKSLKQVNVLLTEKASVLEKQLEEEEKTSVDQLAKDIGARRRWRRKAKRPYDIENTEKRIAELQEACAAKEAAERACDEELRKLRAEQDRATQDKLNAFVVELAKLYVQCASKGNEVQKLQDEVGQLKSAVARLENKARAQTQDKASEVTRPLQLRPVGETPQNKPCSTSLDAPTSSHFEALSIPSTSKQSVAMGAPKRLEKGSPPQCATPSLSPLLMPPPSRALVRPRSTTGGHQLDSSTLLGNLESFFQSAHSPKSPAAQKRPVSSTFGDSGTTAPPCKQPRSGDSGASSSAPASKPARQHPQVPPNERTLSSLAVRTTSVPADAQHKNNSAPVQTQVISSQCAAANATLSFGKQALSKTPQDKHPVAASSVGYHTPSPRDQTSVRHGRQQEELTLHRAQASQPSADQRSLIELSTAGPSRTAQREPLLQSLATSFLLSNEMRVDGPPRTAQPARPSDDQQTVEEMNLPGPSNLAQREPAKSLATSAKWIMGLQEQRSHQAPHFSQSGWQVMEQMGLPVPNVVQGAPARAVSVSAKWGMGLQEQQSHRTAHLPQSASGQQQTSAQMCLPGPSRVTQKQEASHPSTAPLKKSRGLQEPRPVVQPPKEGHVFEGTATTNIFQAEHTRPAQSPVKSPNWDTQDTQSPEHGEVPKPTDSQSSKESPSEFSFGAAALSPEASGEDAGYTLFGEDDDSEQDGGFLAMAGTVAFGKHIYVIGGYDGRGQVTSVERYDTDLDVWEMVAPLNTRRSALSAAVLDGKIYALGGYDGQEYLSTVEVYDPTMNVWTTGPPMPSCKSGQASCSSPAPCVLHKVL
ncbi:hypothetical protein HPB52_015177 [Rhipicephalus sanguineus]|uniref:Uncharacterized protein n=1 Tax=Rhipicephalus sanguineus TaxID=34632 RepID=A0A9D4PD46_RHISA|nr:hypothetical protein HPB52_015177 [Rhipicephalus sanguineus]